MTIERTCEVVVLDERDREVTCGAVAVERVHEWWVCRECSGAGREQAEPSREAPARDPLESGQNRVILP